jgi:sialidase-1
MIWNLGGDSESQIVSGKSRDTRRVFVTSSQDDGRTWAKPEEITSSAKKPDWSWYATGPGIGIQLCRGPYKGRLVIPCDHKRKGDTVSYHSHVIYSDDHGKTWKIGGSTQNGSNECQIIERSDGTLLLNMRRARNVKEPFRLIAASGDGGMSWSRNSFDHALIDPRCQGSLLRGSISGKSEKPAVFFSNVANAFQRSGMTVRISYDEAWAWPVLKVLHTGPSAYSCLAMLPENRLACLFEAGEVHPYEKILFLSFPVGELLSLEVEKDKKIR